MGPTVVGPIFLELLWPPPKTTLNSSWTSLAKVIFGSIYDDRFLLKDVPATRKAFATEQIPYDGAKPMLLVDSEDPIRIAQAIEAMLSQLPKPKVKKLRETKSNT